MLIRIGIGNGWSAAYINGGGLMYTYNHSSLKFKEHYYDVGKLNWENNVIQDYSTFSTEELFQESTIYNLKISLYILSVLQQYVKTCVVSDHAISINETTYELTVLDRYEEL